jgi:hypothetical protein
MKKTIQEIRSKLFSKEILSEHDLLRLRGGDGEEDKRKGVGGNFASISNNNEGNNVNTNSITNNLPTP